MCGVALPRRKSTAFMSAMPLVRPLAQNLRAKPEPRAKPSLFLRGNGEAEPAGEANSGGKAVTRQSTAFCGKPVALADPATCLSATRSRHGRARLHSRLPDQRGT